MYMANRRPRYWGRRGKRFRAWLRTQTSDQTTKRRWSQGGRPPPRTQISDNAKTFGCSIPDQGHLSLWQSRHRGPQGWVGSDLWPHPGRSARHSRVGRLPPIRTTGSRSPPSWRTHAPRCKLPNYSPNQDRPPRVGPKKLTNPHPPHGAGAVNLKGSVLIQSCGYNRWQKSAAPAPTQHGPVGVKRVR
jgi:hypothetical protein